MDTNYQTKEAADAQYVFTSKAIPEELTTKLNETKQSLMALYTSVLTNLPEGRYKSVVKTKLEDVGMWITKSFSHE